VTPEVFRSKVDGWIRLVLILAIVVELGALTAVAVDVRDPVIVLLLLAAGLLGAALFVWVLVGTHYTVDREMLRIASGPFRWRVMLAEIESVEPTRSPLSSPALSLDRLRIRYGGSRFGGTRQVMVSPADKSRFLEAIGIPRSNSRE